MFQEFNEGASVSRLHEQTELTGLAEQFERLEQHGNSVAGSAATIQDLLQRLQDSAFLNDCKSMLESLDRR